MGEMRYALRRRAGRAAREAALPAVDDSSEGTQLHAHSRHGLVGLEHSGGGG